MSITEQQWIEKMANMSLNEQKKIRHQSKLLYRKGHMSPRPSSMAEQTSLPDTFLPAPFNPFWKEKLSAARGCDMKTGTADELDMSQVIRYWSAGVL